MKNSTYLFIHRVLKGIADATIKIFIPLLILQTTGKLYLSFVFALTNYLFTAFFFIVLKRFIQKYSLFSIIIHVIPIIIGELLLLTNLSLWIILTLAILDAFASALYFGALNLIFGFMDENSNTAKFEAGQNLGRIIFTILSAYVLGSLANSLIFVLITSLCLYAMSILPLCIKYKDLKASLVTAQRKPIKEVVKDNKFFNLAHIFQGMLNFLLDIFLPLYLYTNGLSFTTIGLLVAGQYLACILIGYFAKFMIKKNLSNINSIIGCFLFLASLIVLMLVKNIYAIYVFTIVISLSNQLIFINVFDYFTKDQKKKEYYYDSIFYRDVCLNSGRSFMSVLYLIVPLFTPIFAVGMVSVAGMFVSTGLCLNKKDKQNQQTVLIENNDNISLNNAENTKMVNSNDNTRDYVDNKDNN